MLQECVHSQIRTLIEACEQAGNLIKRAQARQQLALDRKLAENPPRQFRIGDIVLLHRTRMENSLSGKLEDKWQGPYYIHDIIGNGSYQIRCKNGMILSKSVHGNHLRLFRFPPELFFSDNDGTPM